MAQLVSRSNPLVKRVLQATFPEYRGRKVRVQPYTGPRRWTVCWDEGSRDQVKLIDLARGTADLRAGSPFQNPEGVLALVDQPENSLLVVHTISCGVDAGITIIARGGPAIAGTAADQPSPLTSPAVAGLLEAAR